MIPVVVAWIALGVGLHVNLGAIASSLVYLVGLLYLAEIVSAIVFMRRRDQRSIGTGLLTMVFVGPIVWSVGCVVIVTNVHS